MAIHPEGEDETVTLAMIRCPHCGATFSVPESIKVEEFACPECGKPVRIGGSLLLDRQ